MKKAQAGPGLQLWGGGDPLLMARPNVHVNGLQEKAGGDPLGHEENVALLTEPS